MGKMQMPTRKRYRSALAQLRPKISPIQWRLLEAHYLAADHSSTANELAQAAGGEGFRATNRFYGALGRKLRAVLGQPVGLGEQQSSILASFEPPTRTRRFWRWVMQPSLAAAIRDLGWFAAEDVGTQSPTAYSLRVIATEGAMSRRMTIHRARERSLRRAKLETARKAHPQGRLVCEVPGCEFDFERVYGKLGEGFAEVHHRKPLAVNDEPMETELADLAVVCSNCHRMIHRGNDCRVIDALIPAVRVLPNEGMHPAAQKPGGR